MLKDVKCSEMKLILEYMYFGNMNVMIDLIEVAEMLQVNGLMMKDSSRNRSDTVSELHREDAIDMVINASINDSDNETAHCNDNLLSLHSNASRHSLTQDRYAYVFNISKDKKSQHIICQTY